MLCLPDVYIQSQLGSRTNEELNMWTISIKVIDQEKFGCTKTVMNKIIQNIIEKNLEHNGVGRLGWARFTTFLLLYI